MNKLAKFSFRLLDLIVIFSMTFGMPAGALAAPAQDGTPPPAPTIASDLPDYAPGALVTLTGTNWQGDSQVGIFVNDDVGQSWSYATVVDVASDGTIHDSFSLPAWFVATYTVAASGQQTGRVITTAFTDGNDNNVGTYDQCANDKGAGYTGSDPGCHWINGNLQRNNSVYFEGDATVQRLWLTDLAPGSHQVTFKYGTTKGGKHAYDFLTTWNWSENWITLADRCQGITGCTTAAETPYDIPGDPSVPNSFEPTAAGARQFVMRGGTLTDATVPQIVSGDYSGDSETAITITFTVPSSGPMCTDKGCSVAVWFGAHVAAQANWGLGMGAGSISGSPYHVALDAVDGVAIGQRDNQMQADVVTYYPNGTIIIIKDAQPNDPQDFNFKLSSSTISQSFDLDDDSDPTLPNTTSPNYSVPPGTYTAQELNIPGGWKLTDLQCSVSGSGGSSFTKDLASATATITVVSLPNTATGDTITCTYTDTKQQNKDLTVSKTAIPSFGRTYKWLIDKSADQTQINIAEGGKATFNYTVTVTPNGYTDTGWAVNGKITVTNSNAFAVSGVSVTDAIDNGGVCTVTGGTNVTVPANDKVVLDYSCTYAAAPNPATGTNTATATWDKDAYYTPNGSAAGTAGVDFTKATITETNKLITVVDDKTDANNPVTLGQSDYYNGPFEFKYSLEKQGVAGTCTDYTNTAKIKETGQSDAQKVTVCVGKDLTVSKTATASLTRTYQWKIDKSVDDTRIEIAEGGIATFNYSVKVTPSGYVNSGFTLGGEITITNPNNWEDITLTGLGDTLDKGGTCSITEAGPYLVSKSSTLTVHYTCVSDGTSTLNTATATWDNAKYFTPTGSASGTANVKFDVTEVNKIITVVDDKTDPNNPVTLGTWNWADGEHTFTYSLMKTGVAGKCTSYDNTATITETQQSDKQTVEVCVGKDLTISKTAAGTFNRTYQWKITKDVDKTLVKIASGGTATFNYTVIAEQTGFTDSGWALSGVITVTNPNDWEDITLTSLSDTVDNGGTCTVAAGPYTVLAGKTLDVAYSCTYSSASALSGKNTATATWDKATYFTPTGSAAAEKAFTLSQVGATNKTVHVTDTFGGDLGTLTATDVTPFTKQTFNYSHDFAGVGGTCTKYDNTATITETKQSDKETVEVCVGLDLTVSKTASGTFNRTYLWKISKAVDQTLVKIAEGGNYTFHYTVVAEQTGVSDAGWTMSGKITLTNPNDWEDITLTSLSDVVDNGGNCTVDPGPYIIPKGGSLDVKYSCSYASKPNSYSGINTATATWDKATYFTPTGSASGSANFTLTQLGSTNKTVHVTDSFQGDLGTVTATDSAPFGKGTFTYDRTEQGVAGTCTKYDNTATITETGATADKSVTLCVGKDLTVTKTAAGTFDRTYKWLIDKSVDDTRIEIANGGTATFNYTVKVTPNGFTDSGWTLSGKITVTNPNDWEDITADVTDLYDGGGTCTVTGGQAVVIPAGKSVILDYSCVFTTQPAYTGKNTATATWNKVLFSTPNGSASGEAGVTLTLKGETNRTITVVDDKTTGISVILGTADYYAGPFEFKYSLDKQGVAGTCTKYDNTAAIIETKQSDKQTVEVCVGLDLTVSKTASGTFNREYLWDIQKLVDKNLVNMPFGQTATFNYTVNVFQTGIKDSGWTLSGKITVTNPNNWEDIMLTGLTDVVDNGGTCTVSPTLPLVPKGSSVDVAYSCTFPVEGPTSYSGTNTATVTWDKALAFTPTGEASGSKAFTLAQLGSTNKTVTVTDTLGGNLGTVTANDAEPWASKEFKYSKGFTGQAGTCKEYDNTTTITETKDTASQKVKVCTAVDLKVTKTAAGSFDRTYKWLIDKSVDKTLVKIVYGGTATFNYTVKVTPNGYTDSGWTLSGKITITNPNDWEDILLTGLTDVMDNGGTCTVDPTLPLIPKGGSVDVAYSCTFPAGGPTSYSGKNTATAAWDKALAFTPTGSASGTANVTLTLKGETNRKITVIDDKTNPNNPVTLGTSDYYAGPFEFKYSLSKQGVPGRCTNYTNTATIKETSQSDSQTVTVCVGINLGAKTMGFWQNKNGQSIILNAASVNGVCKLTTWLRNFAPFQDLSASASCSTAAIYVTNVIKAANASGASMNAMLKGQMLATALDVYFSDPLLGGNKIGAPVPIGGVTINLTYIKANGSYQNVSKAFGGATSMTVMQMVVYAASKSNVGGTLWYNNVKATQELAKNAFDAINNNWVFAP